MPPNNPRFLNILRPKICPRLDLTDFSATQEMKLLGEICKSSECFSIMFRECKFSKFPGRAQNFEWNHSVFSRIFTLKKSLTASFSRNFKKLTKKNSCFYCWYLEKWNYKFKANFLIKIFKISETKYTFWQILKFIFSNWFHDFDYVSESNCSVK